MSASSFYKDAFNLSYGTATPLVNLSDISHWRASVSEDVAEVIQELPQLTYVSSGCFYQVYSSQRTVSDLKKDIHMAIEQKADWLLVPSVTRDVCTHISTQFSCYSIPFMDAVHFKVTTNLDEDLRRELGGKKYRELLRLVRKHEQMFDVEILPLSDIKNDESLLREIASVLNENSIKYSHGINLYSYDVLNLAASSHLGKQYIVKVSRLIGHQFGAIVHVSLSFSDHANDSFIHLVHGQRETFVPQGCNLYLSDYYQLYCYADSLGLKDHNLGRGAFDIKAKVGANFRCELYNILIPLSIKNKIKLSNYICKK
ncbi:TPA: hypothetical protein ACGGS8_003467 [Vibrio cholerae]|nr:hypothetical protein [Vibrio cholerae]